MRRTATPGVLGPQLAIFAAREPELAGLLTGASALLAALHGALVDEDLDGDAREAVALVATSLRETWLNWLLFAMGIPAEALAPQIWRDFKEAAGDAEADSTLNSALWRTFDALYPPATARDN